MVLHELSTVSSAINWWNILNNRYVEDNSLCSKGSEAAVSYLALRKYNEKKMEE